MYYICSACGSYADEPSSNCGHCSPIMDSAPVQTSCDECSAPDTYINNLGGRTLCDACYNHFTADKV